MLCRFPPVGCHPAVALVCDAHDASLDSVMTQFRVVLAVKCNGRRLLPPSYGRNSGWQPEVYPFPVKHKWLVKKQFHELLHKIIQAWQGGGAVLFHCNKGEVRAPCAYGLAMAGIIGAGRTTIRAEIEELGRRRRLHRIFRHWRPRYDDDQRVFEIIESMQEYIFENDGRLYRLPGRLAERQAEGASRTLSLIHI